MPDRRGTPVRRCCRSTGVIVCPLSALGGSISGGPEEKKGEPMTEEGTLSLVRRGTGYQVHYASNNPHDQERRPRACPNEVHLAALLHHFGTELEVITQVCTDVRQGKMAVLLVGLSAEQLQTLFPLIPQAHVWTGAACPASVAPPVAAVVRPDAHRAASRPPRSQTLWSYAREVRGEAEQRVEEFALLLEEAALLLAETTRAVGASHQLPDECHM